MATYEPGDRVLIRSNMKEGDRCSMEDNPGNCEWSDRDHGNYAGQWVTIDSLYTWNIDRCWCYRIKEDSGVGYWFDSMFEASDRMELVEIPKEQLIDILGL